MFKNNLVVIRCIKSFLFFIQHEQFIVRSDLNNFKNYLIRFSLYKSPRNVRLLRWILRFEIFDINFEYIKGTKNVIANFLIREYFVSMNRSNEWIVQSKIPYSIRIDPCNELKYYTHFKRSSSTSLHSQVLSQVVESKALLQTMGDIYYRLV